MGTTNIGQWDETTCNMIACQHPPCWESMRRIENGHPRTFLKKIVIPERDSPESEDRLPTLKIIDLPLNYPQRERIKCDKHLDSISKTISSGKAARSNFSNSTLNDGWIPPISVLSSERNHFPGLNSRIESHSPLFSPRSFTCLRQAEKIQVTDLTEFAVRGLGYQPLCGNTVVKWVPDSHHRFLQPKKPDIRGMACPQRICVKDLALESILSLNSIQGTGRKKSNKVPTGGQPYYLHLRQNQKSSNKSSSAGQKGNPKDSLIRGRHFSTHTLHLLPQNEGDVNLESSEKLSAPCIIQKAPSFDRFEAKVPVKDKISRRSLGQPSIASGGSLVLRRLMAEQLGGAGSSQDKRREGLLQHSQMPPESATGSCKPQKSPGIVAKRKSCMKLVEYKSSMARLDMEECRYCKHLASWKEATLAQSDASEVSREPWPEEDDSQKAQKMFALLQSPDRPPPPPPPPSPPPLKPATVLLLVSLESERGGVSVESVANPRNGAFYFKKGTYS